VGGGRGRDGGGGLVDVGRGDVRDVIKKATCTATECSRDVYVALVLRAHKEE